MKTKINAMRTFLLSVIAMLFVTVAANAQDKAAERAKTVTDSMKVKLSLTDDQYKKVYEANLGFISQMKEGRNAEATKEERVKLRKEMAAQRDERLKAVLTPEQFTAFKADKKENRQRIKEGAMERRQKRQGRK
jgi:hypothetical protein